MLVTPTGKRLGQSYIDPDTDPWRERFTVVRITRVNTYGYADTTTPPHHVLQHPESTAKHPETHGKRNPPESSAHPSAVPIGSWDSPRLDAAN